VIGGGVEATARIDFDRDQVADVRAPIEGIVRRVHVELGAEVDEGTRLFRLESPEIGRLQGTLRASRQRVATARANYERVLKLQEEHIVSERRVEQAEQELEAARAEARSAQAGLRMSGASSAAGAGQFVLRAPMEGTVVHRPATVGTFATAETSLATIADPSSMWALLDVREGDAASVRSGQTATVTVDGLEGHSFTGEVSWVAPEVDPRTRTVRVRVELDNPNGLLRAHQFGRAVVQVKRGQKAVAVPREAVQRLGETSVVFIRTGEGVYEPRPVRLGRARDELVQVWGPVDDGAPVATDGAFLLKTELQSDRIGAGCCEVEPPSGG
jgi:cobalt-zinc-cadmium efflux system membrane fusion protein